jgi:hypothetical protein
VKEEKAVTQSAEDDDSSDGESEIHDGVSTFESGKKSEEMVQHPPCQLPGSSDVRKFVERVIRLVDTVQPRYLGAPLGKLFVLFIGL